MKKRLVIDESVQADPNLTRQEYSDELKVASDFVEEAGGIFVCQLLRMFAAAFEKHTHYEKEGEGNIAKMMMRRFAAHHGIALVDRGWLKEIESFNPTWESLMSFSRFANLCEGKFPMASRLLKDWSQPFSQIKNTCIKVLVEEKTISTSQLFHVALGSWFYGSKDLIKDLPSYGYANELQVTLAKSVFHKVKYVDLEKIQIPEVTIRILPEITARRYEILPLKIDELGDLFIVTGNPLDLDAQQEVLFVVGKRVRIVVAEPSKIRKAINRSYERLDISPFIH